MDFTSTLGTILQTTPSLDDWQHSVLWVLILGFIVAFFLAFGVGANDVANQFGTSVGAKVISLRNACIVATIFELLGAILIGSRVSDTIRKKIVDVEVYSNNPDEYMMGNLAALGGSAIWLLVATFFKMPISGTHSIVGAVLGFSLVARGFDGISWVELGKIVGSWFVSPVLSGCVSGGIFYGINRFILKKDDSVNRGLFALPIFYGITILINIASILLDGPDFLQIQSSLPDWTEWVFGLTISIIIALIVTGVVAVFVVPKLRKEIDAMELIDNNIDGTKNNIFRIGGSNPSVEDSSEVEKPINIPSLEEYPQKHNNMMVTNTFNYIPELNHNYKNDKLNDGNNVMIINENENENNKSNFLQIIPTTGTEVSSIGITPNNSGIPLIKSNDDIELGFNNTTTTTTPTTTSNSSDDGIIFTNNKENDDKPGVGKLFSFLQILTAAFGSFAHGGNDVSNAIGPLIALWLVYKEGVSDTNSSTPIWLLVYGGLGISAGLWIWGRRVIKTMGEDLTKITPSSGFTIEIGAAITVLIASKIGVPVSTTHCKVGSVVFVGWIRTAKGGVDWSLFRNIVFAWLVTVPVSGGLAALLMWILRSTAL